MTDLVRSENWSLIARLMKGLFSSNKFKSLRREAFHCGRINSIKVLTPFKILSKSSEALSISSNQSLQSSDYFFASNGMYFKIVFCNLTPKLKISNCRPILVSISLI